MVYVVPVMGKKIKIRDIERIAAFQCTHREAAGWFDLGVDQFKRFLKKNPKAQEAWDRGQQKGLLSLRRKQFVLAGSNATMAIFLGKQHLGQTDVVTNRHVGADGGPIDIDLTNLSRGERDELRAILQRAARSGSDPQGT